MSRTTVSAGPAKARIAALDAARGMALIAMMAIHVLPGWNADFEPTTTWQLLSGTSAALFAFLAGISLSLSAAKAQAVGGRALTAAKSALAVRAALILALGFLIALLDPPAAIILAYYGAMFLLAIPLLGLSARALGIAAVCFAVLGPLLMQGLRPDLHGLGGYDPSLSMLFDDPGAVVGALLLTGSYPALPWMTYICAGMAVGQLDLASRDIQVRLVVSGAIVGAATWLFALVMTGPLGGREQLIANSPRLGAEGVDDILTWGPTDGLPTSTGWWLTVLSPYSSTPVELLNTLGIAAVVLGVVLFAGTALRSLLSPLAMAGTMSLTLYSAHLVLLATGFLSGRPHLAFVLHVLAAVLFAVLWHNVTCKRQGPLERMVSAAAGWTKERVLAGGNGADSPGSAGSTAGTAATETDHDAGRF
ncbi:DUF1624 domain-containing protein [Arthrobacter sp. Marseille-P9274]|uniref:DUF1624 domain-containing protein n=1 Tax=Arthrobacter sp. Marseille-P9274 TaxID=2866572 RepID=UPI0021CAB9F7|nr:DUF1624 domain-containing protein [Arthrobacter sp. Marseille-P9274]